jgi:hypothetical protein
MVVLMSLAGYLILHLMAYMFVFVEYSALKLSSFPRFMSSYLMGMGFWAFASFINFIGNKPISSTIYFVGLTIILLVFIPFRMVNSIFNPLKVSSEITSTSIYKELIPFSKMIEKYTLPNDKIWFIYQHATGRARRIFAYQIAPRHMNYLSSSLGNKYNPKDVWTDNFTREEFERALSPKKQPYKYLLLARPDDNFWGHYGNMFVPDLKTAKLYTLFIIKKDSEGKVLFYPYQKRSFEIVQGKG